MKFKTLGVIFICLLLAGVWFTHAIFTKKFVDYELVTLKTSRIGLQLPTRADVKIRGVIVGEVLEFEPTGEGAELTLGLDPDQVDTIPENVTASILPKTLFGEKYVSLDIPQAQAAAHIRAGDTIRRTDVSIEVEEVLADLYPLLTTVRPGDLNQTLTAMATALEGRGKLIGQNISILNNYLKRINPQIPALLEDLRLTAEVSDTYAEVMPQIATILRNTVTTTGTLQEKEGQLRQLFTDVSAFSDTAKDFLDQNGDNLIRLGELSVPQTALLAKYAPEYPCLLQGLVNSGKRNAESFRGFTLHINLELLPNQPRAYDAADTPRYGDTRGPSCGQLPNPPWTQENPWTAVPNFDDGVDTPTGKGTSRAPAAYDEPATDPYFGPVFGGTTAETGVLRSMLGQVLAQDPAQVSDLAVLMLAPVARGGAVDFE